MNLGWILLTVSSVILGSWRAYLKIRNISSIYKIRDAPVGMHDLMTEEDYKRFRKNQLDNSIIATLSIVFNLYVNLIKWSTSYDKVVWDFTAAYGSSLSLRATLHSIFDRFLSECVKAPLAVFKIWRRTSYHMNIGEVLLRSMLDIILKTFYSGSLTFGYIQLTDRFGILALLGFLIIFLSVATYWNILYITFLLPYISEPLKDDEVGRNLKTLANGLGYPHEKIRITITDTTSKKQDIHYYRLLGYEMIIVTRRVLRILVPLQVTALVTKELGHWKFQHESLSLLFHVINYFGYCYALLFSYGNGTIEGIFGFEVSESHPYMPLYLTIRYIWPIGSECIRGFGNVVRRECIFQADDFASDKGLTAPLRSGLLVMAATLKNHPLYDSWHSAWVHGEPTILERVARLNSRIPKLNVTFQSMSTVNPLLRDSSEESSAKPSLESNETGEHSEAPEREKQTNGDDQFMPGKHNLHSDTDEKLLKKTQSKSSLHRKNSDEAQSVTGILKSKSKIQARKRSKESPTDRKSPSP